MNPVKAARALTRIYVWKGKGAYRNPAHLARVLRARAERERRAREYDLRMALERRGYEVVLSFDEEVGWWAEARLEGRRVASVCRAPDRLEALRALAGELGVHA